MSNYKYDNRGNVVEVTNRDQVPTALLWGYRQARPVAKVENATYAQLTTVLGFDPGNPAQAVFQNATGDGLLTTLQTLRAQLPTARVTTYAHQPLIGLTRDVDPNGKALHYEYDAFNRLKNLRDAGPGGFVRASYCYNYAGQPVDCGTVAPTGVIAPSQLFLLADSPATSLQVTPDSLHFTYSAGRDSLLVRVLGDSLTQDWEIRIPAAATWLTATPTQGKRDSTKVFVEVTAAPSANNRRAVLEIYSAELDTTLTVVVFQAGRCLPPTIAGDSVRALCAGSSTYLLASGCPGGTIRWSTSQTGVGITVTTPGSYSATCESTDCQSAASRSILVQAVTAAAPTVVASVDTICAGQALQLTATGCAGAVSWNSSIAGLIPENTYASQITVKPSQNGTFTARCLNMDCPSGVSAPVAVTVKPSPDYTIVTDGMALCAGDTLQLSVSTT